MEIPKIGSLWTHKSGSIYKVQMITNESSTKDSYPITVVYIALNTSRKVWSRPLSDWHRSMVMSRGIIDG